MMNHKLPYRLEIDGLRAIAVSAVVAFHAGIPGTANGYLGVDIFFVISGYLILGATVEEVAQNRFSIITFLVKRALRIFPLLALVILVTIAAATFFPIVPSEAKEISTSAWWSSLFAANFYFAKGTGYFSAGAESKPLLHMWSLAVEEQFYSAVAIMAFSAILVGRFQARLVFLALGAVCLVGSMILWVSAPSEWSEKAFYMLPWRAWEFLLGGLAAVLAARNCNNIKYLAEISILGLFFSLAVADSSNIKLGALLIVPATAALLYAGGTTQNGVAMRFLRLPLMTAIGRVSYGWYLWHWPLLFYGRSLSGGEMNLAVDVSTSLLALLLAVGTYFLIEKPMRPLRAARRPAFANLRWILACTAMLVLAGSPGSLMLNVYNKKYAPFISQYHEASMVIPSGTRGDTNVSFRIGNGKPEIVFFGDSHVRSLYGAALELNAETGKTIQLIWSRSCIPTTSDKVLPPRAEYVAACVKARAMFKEALSTRPKTVVIHAFWAASNDVDETLREQERRNTLTKASESAERVLLIGQVPTFTEPGADCVFRASIAITHAAGCKRSSAEFASTQAWTMKWIKVASEGLQNVRVLDPVGAFCRDGICYAETDGQAVYQDKHHLNLKGSRQLSASSTQISGGGRDLRLENKYTSP